TPPTARPAPGCRCRRRSSRPGTRRSTPRALRPPRAVRPRRPGPSPANNDKFGPEVTRCGGPSSAGLDVRGGRGGVCVRELRAALRAEHDPLARVHHELAAREALERRAAEEREQLLFERAGEQGHAHSSRNTPTTRPRTSTWPA